MVFRLVIGMFLVGRDSRLELLLEISMIRWLFLVSV